MMIRTAREFYGKVARDIESRPDWFGGTATPELQRAHATAVNMRSLLDDAQVFVLSEEVAEMVSTLLTEMGDGVEEMFSGARMPFPVLWLERRVPTSGETHGTLVAQTETMCLANFMLEAGGRFFPSLTAMHFEDGRGTHYAQPHYERAIRTSDPASRAGYETLKQKQEEMCMFYFGMAMGVSEMLNHKGMLEVETRPAHSRQERRRAAKRGEKLPDTRVSRIFLGEFGRAQVQAMEAEGVSDGRRKKRAHWVRGHFMRTRSGGVTWRMPHIRGAGPLISQERRLELPGEDPSP